MSNTQHGQECREQSGKCRGISHCVESGHPACIATKICVDKFCASVQFHLSGEVEEIFSVWKVLNVLSAMH